MVGGCDDGDDEEDGSEREGGGDYSALGTKWRKEVAYTPVLAIDLGIWGSQSGGINQVGAKTVYVISKGAVLLLCMERST